MCAAKGGEIRLWFWSKTGKCWSKTVWLFDSTDLIVPNALLSGISFFFFKHLCLCVSYPRYNMVVLPSKGSCEENCTEDVMIYQALFPACFLTACFLLSVHDLCEETHPFHAVRTKQNGATPTDRGRSLVCWVMSVFGEDECVGWWGVRWVWRWEKKSVVGDKSGTRSPTEMLNSITDRKRGNSLYKDEEKSSTFNLCAA